MAGNQCPNCGAENEQMARFCRSCGTKLEETAEPEPEQENVEPVMSMPVITPTPARAAGKKSNLWIFLIAGAAALAVILVLTSSGKRRPNAAQGAAVQPQAGSAESPAAQKEPQTENNQEEPEPSEPNAAAAPETPPVEMPEKDLMPVQEEAFEEPEEENEQGGYILENVASYQYSKEEIMQCLEPLLEQGYSVREALRLARNECYALYGNVFRDASLNRYFYEQNAQYYAPDPGTTAEEIADRRFNSYIRKNIEVIKELEAYY